MARLPAVTVGVCKRASSRALEEANQSGEILHTQNPQLARVAVRSRESMSRVKRDDLPRRVSTASARRWINHDTLAKSTAASTRSAIPTIQGPPCASLIIEAYRSGSVTALSASCIFPTHLDPFKSCVAQRTRRGASIGCLGLPNLSRVWARQRTPAVGHLRPISALGRQTHTGQPLPDTRRRY